MAANWMIRGIAARVLSLLIASVYVVFSAYCFCQTPGAPRTLAPVLWAVAATLLVWFPQQIGDAVGYYVGRGKWVDQPSPAWVVAGAGWFFLVVLPLGFMLYCWWC